MKKLTLIPKSDTVTICLPPDWVGKVIMCTLHNTDEEADDMVYPMAAERKIPYNAPQKRGRKRKMPNAN